MTDDFDVQRAMSDLTAGLALRQNQARLSFSERCGAFCALYNKTPQSIVALAFGITKTTASLLAGCLPEGLDHKSVGLGFSEVVDGRVVPLEIVTDHNPNRSRDWRARYQELAR